MEFSVDPHSNISPQLQIEEQVRIALLLGRLRPGDTLPSIRDVEAQCGVSRNIVRQAYIALQDSRILALRQGKGVLVEKELNYEQRMKVIERSMKLCEETIRHAEALDITASSFARLLYQQARNHEQGFNRILYVDSTRSLATERASAIETHLHADVRPLGMDELASISEDTFDRIRVILTSYFRFEEVRKLVGQRRIDVIPLSLIFSQQTRDDLHLIEPNTTVALVNDDQDFAAATFLLDSYHAMMPDPSIKVKLIRSSEVTSSQRLVQNKKFSMVIFSNRLWEKLPAEVRESPKATRPHMAVDLASLESVRMRIGVII